MAAYTTIDDPEAYFQTVLYTGNGADGNAITLPGDTAMQPDFVWIKERSTTNEYRLYDDVRGVNAALHSSTTGGETAAAAYGQFESFDSDGFTVGQGTGDPGNGAGTNQDGATIVAWCWKESATAGFDIVSYTGNATNRTISHSLSAVPKFIIVKNRTDTSNVLVYHGGNTSAPATDGLYMNTTDATDDDAGFFNDTDPTSSVFSVGTNNNANGNTDAMIAYLFAEKQGFSKFGSWIGNGNADGPFLFCGFRPAMIIGKNTARTEDWFILDAKRDTFNPVDERLQPNSSGAESTVTTLGIDFCANGFKLRGATNQYNASGETMIFMAFAEAPLVNSKGVPCNAR
jgi:hypothetical protein